MSKSFKLNYVEQIAENRDLALYQDVMQKNEYKCPDAFYASVLELVQEKDEFTKEDYYYILYRYGQAKGYGEIASLCGINSPATVRYRIMNIMKLLKKHFNKPIEKDDFAKGLWNGKEIKEMATRHIQYAISYAEAQGQRDKVEELKEEFEKRTGTPIKEKNENAKPFDDAFIRFFKLHELYEFFNGEIGCNDDGALNDAYARRYRDYVAEVMQETDIGKAYFDLRNSERGDDLSM